MSHEDIEFLRTGEVNDRLMYLHIRKFRAEMDIVWDELVEDFKREGIEPPPI